MPEGNYAYVRNPIYTRVPGGLQSSYSARWYSLADEPRGSATNTHTLKGERGSLGLQPRVTKIKMGLKNGLFEEKSKIVRACESHFVRTESSVAKLRYIRRLNMLLRFWT